MSNNQNLNYIKFIHNYCKPTRNVAQEAVATNNKQFSHNTTVHTNTTPITYSILQDVGTNNNGDGGCLWDCLESANVNSVNSTVNNKQNLAYIKFFHNYCKPATSVAQQAGATNNKQFSHNTTVHTNTKPITYSILQDVGTTYNNEDGECLWDDLESANVSTQVSDSKTQSTSDLGADIENTNIDVEILPQSQKTQAQVLMRQLIKEKMIICKFCKCDYKTYNAANFKEHLKMHANNLFVLCTFCKYIGKRKYKSASRCCFKKHYKKNDKFDSRKC